MKKSKFDLSHQLLMTGDFGWLYPIICEDILPGDTFKCSSEVFIKAIPLLAPIMAQCDVRVDYFFVPNRLLWENWSEFITGGSEGTNDLIEPWIPLNDNGGSPTYNQSFSKFASALYQIPLNRQGTQSGRIKVSALPAMAYERIYQDWYLDQNVEPQTFTIGNKEYKFGYIPNTDFAVSAVGQLDNSFISNNFKLRQRKYRKDMFTSSLPWPQRGPEVGFAIPPQEVDPIVYGYADQQNTYKTQNPTQTGEVTLTALSSDTSGRTASLRAPVHTGSTNQALYHDHTLSANVPIEAGSLGTLTIRELRRLSALQKWFERNARWGGRYIEQILSHFGVRTPDYRLDRSEYLGGTISPLNISETYQTAQGVSGQETADVLGQYAGHLTSYAVNGMRKYRAEEHGWFIGLLSIVPKPAYGQGIQRRFTRLSRLDYAWPEFAAIGEQAIAKKELYYAGYDELNTDQSQTLNSPFGYTTRYAEYKSRQDRFDPNFITEFPFWHLGRIFENMPVLSKQFLEARDQETLRSQYDRIFAYTPNDQSVINSFHLLFQIQHHLKMKRPLPKYVSPHLS